MMHSVQIEFTEDIRSLISTARNLGATDMRLTASGGRLELTVTFGLRLLDRNAVCHYFLEVKETSASNFDLCASIDEVEQSLEEGSLTIDGDTTTRQAIPKLPFQSEEHEFSYGLAEGRPAFSVDLGPRHFVIVFTDDIISFPLNAVSAWWEWAGRETTPAESETVWVDCVAGAIADKLPADHLSPIGLDRSYASAPAVLRHDLMKAASLHEETAPEKRIGLTPGRPVGPDGSLNQTGARLMNRYGGSDLFKALHGNDVTRAAALKTLLTNDAFSMGLLGQVIDTQMLGSADMGRLDAEKLDALPVFRYIRWCAVGSLQRKGRRQL